MQNKIKKNEACSFQIHEINQLIKESEAEFKIQRDKVEDKQLPQMKKDLKKTTVE